MLLRCQVETLIGENISAQATLPISHQCVKRVDEKVPQYASNPIVRISRFRQLNWDSTIRVLLQLQNLLMKIYLSNGNSNVR